jgi:hypothetical protein
MATAFQGRFSGVLIGADAASTPILVARSKYIQEAGPGIL